MLKRDYFFKSSYGRIISVDMNPGGANGDGLKDHPMIKYLNLGPLGIPGRSALLITNELIFAGEGSSAI